MTARHERLDSGKSALRWASKEEVSSVQFPQIGDELIARITSVKEKDVSGRDQRQQALSFFPLRAMYAHDTSGHGQTPEDVVGSGEQALRNVPLPSFPKPLLGSNSARTSSVAGRVYLEPSKHRRTSCASDRKNRRPKMVGQIDRSAKKVAKNGPADLLSCPCEPLR